MKKSLLGKIMQNHPIAMILCCAIPLALIAILSLTGNLGSLGLYALFLLCPLLHILMMRGHGSHAENAEEHTPPALNPAEKPFPSPPVANDRDAIKDK